jgi:CHAT domain-containing protein
VASLRAALHAAGVRHVISTLWSIDDLAALQFSRVLHEGLWERGLNVEQAFARARESLRDAGAPVRDWGAWLLTDGQY